jgi:N-acetylglutamate synthase-like GNAT family acetyltransferase
MVHIRPAEPNDSHRIAELYAQLVENPAVNVLPERIAQIAEDPNTGLFVCERDGVVEGTALVSLCADAMFGFQPFAVVESIVVNQILRGSGLGSALIQHIEVFCLNRDCSKIMLLSASQRTDAHRFFERAGFAGSTKRGFVKYRHQFRA